MAFKIHLTMYESFLIGACTLLVYACVLVVSRLFFHPLSRFPGPKLAAATLWYEFYYDVILPGQYSFKVRDLHKQYNSSIIRISPTELHISDPDFVSELFSGTSRKRDIDEYFAAQFGAPGAHFTTLNHDLHRERRAALSSFFSTASVRKLQPVIEERVDKLFEKFCELRDKSEVVDLGLAFSAITNDVISAFCFGASNHYTEASDWGVEETNAMFIGTVKGHLMKHLPILRRLVEMTPEKIMMKLMPAYGVFAAMRMRIAERIRVIQKQREDLTWNPTHQTIFSEILDSKLPLPEKSPSRLACEARALIQAGTLTAAWTLSVTFFHLLSQPEMLRKLRQELVTAIPDPDVSVPLVELEHLPYLSACIKEGLRLSFGASGRLPRIPTDEILVLKDKKNGKEWKIPMGTKCSMTMEHILTDPENFTSPELFRPERWIEDEKKQLEKYFVPFAKGSRICLGQHLAYAEIYLVMAKLFRRLGGPGSENGEGVFRLWETEERDVVMAGDFFIPMAWAGSKGVRATLKKV